MRPKSKIRRTTRGVLDGLVAPRDGSALSLTFEKQ